MISLLLYVLALMCLLIYRYATQNKSWSSTPIWVEVSYWLCLIVAFVGGHYSVLLLAR